MQRLISKEIYDRRNCKDCIHSTFSFNAYVCDAYECNGCERSKVIDRYPGQTEDILKAIREAGERS